MQVKPPYLKISIIINNLGLNANLKTSWGFSCLVEGAEKTILFDTGDDGRILLAFIKPVFY